MHGLGPAAEWHRLSERYSKMTDEEVIALAERLGELTDAAQQLLVGEISRRKLKISSPTQDQQSSPPLGPDSGSEDDPYAEDRELEEICNVFSLRDALQLQRLLDSAYIPFFMGPERATRAEAVTSKFSNGVSVQVMRIGLPQAGLALRHYEPADEPVREKCQDESFAVRCPRCHSTDIVLNDLVNEGPSAASASPQKFQWTCDSCGHEWQDDGVETEG